MLKESRKFSHPDLNTPNIFCMNALHVSESRFLCLNISTTEMVKNIMTTTMTKCCRWYHNLLMRRASS